MKLGTNMAVFFLFFGVALLEALWAQNWLLTAVFLLFGLIFLYADNRKHK